MKVAFFGNLESNSSFLLQRYGVIHSVCLSKGIDVDFHNIYELARDVFSSELLNFESFFLKYIGDKTLVIAHKEILQFIPHTYLENLRKRKIPIIGFIGDEEIDKHGAIECAVNFDLSVVYVKSIIEELNKLKLTYYFMPEGANFKVNSRKSQALKSPRYEVVFIGKPYHPRPRIIKGLISAGINIGVFGSEEWRNHIPEHNYFGFVSNDDYNEVVSEAKILLALMEFGESEEPHMNAKHFDAAVNGVMSIGTYYSPFVSEFGLIEGTNYCSYRTEKDLLEKIIFYLNNDNIRNNMAREQALGFGKCFDYNILYDSFFNFLLKKQEVLLDTNKNVMPGLEVYWRRNESENVYVSNAFKKLQYYDYNDEFDLLVCHTSYKNKLVFKRLNVVDQYSVFVKSDAMLENKKSDLTSLKSKRYRRTNLFTLNEQNEPGKKVSVLFKIYILMEQIREKYRNRYRA